MASQQPPARPWFRLASMARPPSAPTPTPAASSQAPQPRAPYVLPTFTQTFVTPATQPTQPPPPQEPVPPPPPPSAPQTPTPPSPLPATQAPAPPSPQPATRTPAPPPPEPRQPTPPPPSPIAPAPPRAVIAPPSPPPPPRSVVTPPSPPPPVATTTSSVLKSPIIKTSTPSPKSSSTSTTPQIASSSLPPSPKPRATSVPSSSLPTNLPSPKGPKPLSPSPVAPPPPSPTPVAAPTATGTAPVTTPTPSPKIRELTQPKAPSPPPKVPSPHINPLAHPPSPLTLPPAQLKSDMEHHANIPPEAEQKTILVQETIGTTPKVHVSPGIAMNRKQDLTRDTKTKEHDNHYKKLSESEEFGMRVITIAGENKGAIMELGPTPNSQKYHEFGGGNLPGLHMKGNPRGTRGGGKLVIDGSNSSNEEGMIKSKDKSDKNLAPISSPPLKAFMNSNAQGVNNSILFNCSCTHHDPGVHLSLSRKANGGGVHVKDRTNGEYIYREKEEER